MRKYYNNLSLKRKVMLSVLSISTLIFITIIGFITYQSRELSINQAIQLAKATASGAAINAEKQVNAALSVARGSAHYIEGLRTEGLLSRVEMHTLDKALTTRNRLFLSVWQTWDTNSLDGDDASHINGVGSNDAGRFANGWYWSGNEVLEQITSEQETLEDADYYDIPMSRKRETILEPYFYSYTESDTDLVLMTSVTVPIFSPDKKALGVFGIDIGLDTIQSINKRISFFETGYGKLLTSDGLVVADKDTSTLAKLSHEYIQGSPNLIKALKDGTEYISWYDPLYTNRDTLKVSIPMNIGKTGQHWSYMIIVPNSEILSSSRQIARNALLFGVIGLVLLAFTINAVSAVITKPIKEGIHLTAQIAGGDLTATIEQNSTDEIGLLMESLQKMTNKLREIITNIKELEKNISTASSQFSVTSQQLAEGANEQAASTEQVSSSMEQMAANIEQNAMNARQTGVIARRTTEEMRKMATNVNNTLRMMKTIAEKITIVDEIAEKTDLLAVNAAIEAARAGEFGRGFSVVATEVRKLSERTQKAAREIKEMSINTANEAEISGQMLNLVIPEIEKTTLLVEEITAGSIEQETGASQINSALVQLSSVTQANAASAEELASSAHALLGQLTDLKDTISFFMLDKNQKLDNNDFLRKLKELIAESEGALSEKAMEVLLPSKESRLKSPTETKSVTAKGIDITMDDKDDQFESF